MPAQSIAKEACALMWVLMDHNPQLIEDFTHANLGGPGVPSPATSACAGPAVMVRPPSRLPSPLESATQASSGIQSMLESLAWELGMPALDVNPQPVLHTAFQASHPMRVPLHVPCHVCFARFAWSCTAASIKELCAAHVLLCSLPLMHDFHPFQHDSPSVGHLQVLVKLVADHEINW